MTSWSKGGLSFLLILRAPTLLVALGTILRIREKNFLLMANLVNEIGSGDLWNNFQN